MSDARPIGIFDSGLGGLTLVRELHRLMPHEKVIYFGDTARSPYGARSDNIIKAFGIQNAAFCMERDIKMLIVACSVISAVLLDDIRRRLTEIPVIGVVLPGCKAAILRTAEKKVGVIGDHAAIRSGAYAKTIHSIESSVKVYSKACPLFTPLVDEGLHKSEITRMAAQHYLYELVDIGIDCLILGGAQYALLMEIILGTVGTSIQLVDSSFWTAKEAQDILIALNALAPGGTDGRGESEFFVSDVFPGIARASARFLGKEAPEMHVASLDRLVKLSI